MRSGAATVPWVLWPMKVSYFARAVHACSLQQSLPGAHLSLFLDSMPSMSTHPGLGSHQFADTCLCCVPNRSTLYGVCPTASCTKILPPRPYQHENPPPLCRQSNAPERTSMYVYTKASIRIMLKLRGSTFLHSYIAAITMSS